MLSLRLSLLENTTFSSTSRSSKFRGTKHGGIFPCVLLLAQLFFGVQDTDQRSSNLLLPSASDCYGVWLYSTTFRPPSPRFIVLHKY